MQKINAVLIFVVAWLLCSPITTWAGFNGNHYVNGGEGIKVASVPPPGTGTYYRFYNMFYHSDELMDSRGHEQDVDFDAFVYAGVHRLIQFYGTTLFGADFFADLVVPIVYTDLEIGAAGVKDNDWDLGDIFIEPVALAWHGERWDAVYGMGVHVPIGPCNKNRPAYPGKDYWTAMFSLGGTVYLDSAKTWSASTLGRYEVHSKKDGEDMTAGDDFHLEWGVGKKFPAHWKLGPLQAWEIGAAGYAQWQITDDKGDDVTWDKDVHDRVFAVGPELRCEIPRWKLLLELRCEKEFGAKDRSEGVLTSLVLTTAL